LRRASDRNRSPTCPIRLIILAAASTDPEAARVWQDLHERLGGMSMFAKALDEAGHLRPGVSVADARDVPWTYNSAALYQLLVTERKWSARRYGRWVTDALTAALFA
jgi:hypothetical protein